MTSAAPPIAGSLEVASPADDPVWQRVDRHMPWVVRDGLFGTQHLGAGRALDQGWKLHVSATPWSAPEVLDRVLPIALEAGVSSKVVNTRVRLLMLNNGLFGATQAGKFVTLYPSSDEQAVDLAVRLHEATRGLHGPRIATDRPLVPGSLVHYRYGAFRRIALTSEGDEDLPDARDMLQDAEGRLTRDRRELVYVPPPAGIDDPFERAGAYRPRPPAAPPLAGRYLVVGVLGTSPTGGVYRAIDLDARPPRQCVLKEFWRDAGGDLHGRLAPDLGHLEADLLARHADDEGIPDLLGRVEIDGTLLVAVAYVPGRSLAAELAAREHVGEAFSVAEAVAIARSAARAIAQVHEHGVVMRDVTPGNLVGADGTYRLVDFGIAHDAASGPPAGLGTVGFCSPQQWAEAPPAPSDDVFAWGAVVHRLLCGAPEPRPARSLPSTQPRPPLRTLRPDVPRAVAAVVDRAVAWDAADRYATMAEALADLERATPRAPVVAARADPPAREPPRAACDPDTALQRAPDIGDALCDAALRRDGGVGWATKGPYGATTFCGPDLYHGAAGIGLFLAELARATGDERYADTARDAARWLAGPVWSTGRADPGLYCGEAGIAWFFLRLAEVLDEPGFATAADLRARRLRGLRTDRLDLVGGLAGWMVVMVRLALATGRREHLADARAAADVLVRRATRDGARVWWADPARTPAGPGPPYLGLSHGSAGIALALAELAAATGDEAPLAAAEGVADVLLDEARPSPDGGWTWGELRGADVARVQSQCHGAIGIGQLFLRLHRIAPRAQYAEAARQAARTAVREARDRTSPCLCHGVAGDAGLLLDGRDVLGDPDLAAGAADCAGRLHAFRDPERPGTYRTHVTHIARPDLLVGDAGIGWVLLRLADPAPLGDPVLR